MDLGLEGRVALVTGASKGMGLGIAKALIAEGASVAITSRSQERIDDAARTIGATGFAHDSANTDGVGVLVHEVEHHLGPIEILVTNTGGPPTSPDPLSFSADEWREAFEALVLGPLAFVEATLPEMRHRRWGRILNVSSTAVREPIPNLILSNANRSAALATWKTIARQAAQSGVTMNTLIPGRIATDRLYELYGSREAADDMARHEIPAGRLGSVDEFAAAAAFLCSNQASYITGAALAVDGGMLRSL
jgi:3-oxoacyl-[acyl-carrier protein] reductase